MKKNEFLEKLRKDLGYSRKKIANYLEVSSSAIEKYEKGKLDFNHKTKYILGICALAGFNNEIFHLSEIDEYDKYEYKISFFSSKLREILYFFDLDYDEYELFILKILQNTFNTDFILDTDYMTKSINLKKRLINQSYFEQQEVIEFITNKQQFLKNFRTNLEIDEKEKENFIISYEKDLEQRKVEFLSNIRFEILLLSALKKFNPKEFYEKEKFPFFQKALKNFDSFNKCFNYIPPIGIVTSIYYYDKDEEYLKKIFPSIKQTLEELITQGKPVIKETIKEFKIELETGAIFLHSNQPTDPKDKEICELLQYAPPAFKDKIIEKLKKFKDKVEDI
ncbi:hypothetical protein JCM11957_10720 [Caminibacter profundus]